MYTVLFLISVFWKVCFILRNLFLGLLNHLNDKFEQVNKNYDILKELWTF